MNPKYSSSAIIIFLVLISVLFLFVSTEALASAGESETTIGNTFTDIWNYNTQSVSNIGKLVTNIWSMGNQDLTSSPKAGETQVSLSDIEEINKIIDQNKQLLEKLSLRPVVKDLNEDPKTQTLTEKLEQTKTTASNIYSGIQNLKSRSLLLSQKWPNLTESEIRSELTLLSSIFTQDTTQKDTSILAGTNWLKTSWDSPIMVNILDETRAIESQIENLLNDLVTYGKVSSTSILDPILDHIKRLDRLIGNSLSQATDPSLFGFIKKTSEQIEVLNKQSAEGMRILSEINDNPAKDQTSAIAQLTGNLLGINLVPNADLFFSTATNSYTSVNKVLSLLALIDSNKLLLSGKAGQVTENIWLEEGLIFHIAVSNLSRTQIQTGSVKFILPPEISKEQITSYDPEIAISADSAESALVASGEILLAPLETRIFTVEAEDIWHFNLGEIKNLKTQVYKLTTLLQNSTNSAKGEAIQTDILATLDKILLKEKQVTTPEARIIAFREASLEMNKIEEKISSLKSLTVESRSQGSVLGLTGGFQTPSVLGIIILTLSSLFFWLFYSKALKDETGAKKQNLKITRATSKTTESSVQIQYHTHEESRPRLKKIITMVTITLLSGGLGSLGASLVLKTTHTQTENILSGKNNKVLGSSIEIVQKKFPYEVNIIPPKLGSIPVRSSPSITSPQIRSLNEAKIVSVFKKVDQWVMITGMDDKNQSIGWWINDIYLDSR